MIELDLEYKRTHRPPPQPWNGPGSWTDFCTDKGVDEPATGVNILLDGTKIGYLKFHGKNFTLVAGETLRVIVKAHQIQKMLDEHTSPSPR